MSNISNYAMTCLTEEQATSSIFSTEEIYMAVNGYDEELADYLKNIRGIYLLEFLDGSFYVGSAFSREGLFTRWKKYIKYSAGNGNPMSAKAKKEGLPTLIAQKFSADKEIFLTDDEDYITFYILHTVEGQLNQVQEKKLGIFDSNEMILEDMLAFVREDNYVFYQNLNDNQKEEKYFKQLFNSELNEN